MARKGEKYKHNQIKDVTYVVDTVDTKNQCVYLKDADRGGSLIRVTLTQLYSQYRPV